MALAPGTRIGVYEVTGHIGAGGMGEVYRATDSNLKRSVAIKVLPASVAGDVDRLARFQREAEVLAALNHPNIAAIYGLEKTSDVTALVMELVDGEDLSQRIARGAIPVDEALAIARQIAEALEAAHEQGIIHRDLKPANIKVRPDGTIKVLDFGLAKPMDPLPASGGAAAVANSPTITSPALTEHGIILGTAAYMSPEQAAGKPVDKRSDLWAFGVVLLEMLTGRRAFAGPDVVHVLAAVLKTEPDWTSLPAETPAAVRRLLRRCLEKDRRRRIADASDVRLDLDEDNAATTTASPTSRRSPWWAVVAAVIGTGALAALVAWQMRPSVADVPLLKVELNARSFPGRPFLSPDGRRVAYVSSGKLWVQDLDQLQPHAIDVGKTIAPAPGGLLDPLFWSPNSRELGFTNEDTLWRVSTDGGAAVPICRLPNRATMGAAWGPNGRIVFSSYRGPLYEVAASGAEPPVVRVELTPGIEDYHYPQFLPSGALIYAPHQTTERPPYLETLSGSQRTQLPGFGESIRGVQYASGHLLELRQRGGNSGIWAIPFDANRLTTTGDAFLVAPHATSFSTSLNGGLVYDVNEASGLAREFVWLNRAGVASVVPGVPQRFGAFVLSPDGTRIAAVVTDNNGDGIMIIDAARGASTPLVASSRPPKFGLTWSPDGQRILFVEGRGSSTGRFTTQMIRVVPADGRGQPHDLVSGGAPTVSTDGRVIYQRDDRGLVRLWRVSLADAETSSTAVRDSADSTSMPAFSPDGKLIAYRQGTNIFISRSDGSGQWPVSVGGGTNPQWNPATGDVVYSIEGGKVMTVPITFSRASADAVIGTARQIFQLPDATGWRLSPDGARILTHRVVSGQAVPERQLMLIQNWPAEFRAKKVRAVRYQRQLGHIIHSK